MNSMTVISFCTGFEGSESLTKWETIARLKACSNTRELKLVHAEASRAGNDSNNFVANTLVSMYAKCGSLEHAQSVFDGMQKLDVVSWNTLILGYAENGKSDAALELFDRMRPEGYFPNERTFVAALKACTRMAVQEEGKRVDGKVVKLASLRKGESLHEQVASSAYRSDVYIASTLVDLYAKCGKMCEARRVFDRMKQHSVVSWTALMKGYAENGEEDLALDVFARMIREGCVPNARTLAVALKVCISLASKEDGKRKWRSLEMGISIHLQAATGGSGLEKSVENTLICMYAKCGSLIDARNVFDRIREPDVVSWTAMISGYAENEQGEQALELFASMRLAGCPLDSRTFVAALKACVSLKDFDPKQLLRLKSLEKAVAIHAHALEYDTDSFVATTLVDVYAKLGSLRDAREVFDRIQHRSVVDWTALMMGYAENEEGELAINLLSRMRLEGCAPNVLTFVAALKACSTAAALQLGKSLHADIRSLGLENQSLIASSLVDFYGRCGSMLDAQAAFDSLKNTKNLVIWNSLIAGYSRQGDTQRVFDLFERLRDKGLRADGITFSNVLLACCHAGLAEKGMEFFQAMSSQYGIEPGLEHYRHMIDILGRANRLEEAVAMLKSMPFEPDTVAWTAVLDACRRWNNVEIGRLAFDSLLAINRNETGAYVLMEDIYKQSGAED